MKGAREIAQISPEFPVMIYLMNFKILSNIFLPCLMALIILAKLSSRRIICAASLDTSVPLIPMAMPMSAFLSAGASFTPSPVMATKWFLFCNAWMILNFCSGLTRAKTLIFSSRMSNFSSVSFASSVPVRTRSSSDVIIPRSEAIAEAVSL